MMNKRLIIGVDPGVKTGIATFYNGKLLNLQTSYCFNDFLYFEKLRFSFQEKATVVIEDSRLQSHIFTAPSVKGAAKLKIARNVGQLDMICAYIFNRASDIGCSVRCVSPKQKGRKLNADDFNAITGWKGKSNQHERDAAMVAWPYVKIKE
jgi:hypothetical protein